MFNSLLFPLFLLFLSQHAWNTSAFLFKKFHVNAAKGTKGTIGHTISSTASSKSDFQICENDYLSWVNCVASEMTTYSTIPDILSPTTQLSKISMEDVDAYILPQGITWPTMISNIKQTKTVGKRILFHRTDNASMGREEETWRRLNLCESVIWTGLPGIGKSLSVMPMLMKAVRAMKENIEAGNSNNEDWFHTVFYHDYPYIMEINYERESGFVVQQHEAKSLDDARDVYEKLRYRAEREGRKSILLVEIRETEIDPKFSGSVLLCPSATRVVEETCKTYCKRGSDIFLLEPPSREVLMQEYRVLQLMEDKLPGHIDTEEKFEKLLEVVGPVPRYLFNTDPYQVKRFLSNREDNIDNALRDITEASISYSNVGEHLKFFAAPYIRPGVTIPEMGRTYVIEAKEYLDRLSPAEKAKELGDGRGYIESNRLYKFQFLTKGCSILLASRVKNPKEIEFWKTKGRPHELLEATIKYARYSYPTNNDLPVQVQSVLEKSRLNNWLFYNDSGSTELRESHRITNIDKKPYLLTTWHQTAKFDGNFLNYSVHKLQEGKLYESIGCTLACGEYLLVDHTYKVVIMDQVTLSVLRDHEFNTQTVDNILANLGMLEGKGKEYKLVIIGVNDQSLKQPTGMKFFLRYSVDTNSSDDSEKPKDIKTSSKSLAEWQEQLEKYRQQSDNSIPENQVWLNADRVETYIARVNVFDMDMYQLHQDTPLQATYTKPEKKRKTTEKKKPNAANKKKSE